MDIFVLIGFLGGLALFLYGMRTMGQGLESLSGGGMRATLARLCSTPWRGVLVGAAVTAAIQSSSATTVMVIGFVNSGLMTLGHAVGVIMGANLGTTVTSWLLSLTGIGGDSTLLRLLKPESLASLLTLIGVVLLLLRRADGHERRGRVGSILAGLGILFFGMEMMSGAVEPLTASPGFVGLLTLFSSPVAGLLVGAAMTAIVQSSSAAIGILQALTASGGVTLAAAVPIVMGQNVGTCITTLLSSVGASKNARRAALVHLYFNAIGAAVLMAIFCVVKYALRPELLSWAATPAAVAGIHTAFNVLSLLLLYPFSRQLERLTELTVSRRRRPADGAVDAADEAAVVEADAELRHAPHTPYSLLDPRFLRSPALALEVCRRSFLRMLGLSRDSLAALRGTDDGGAAVEQNERLIDHYKADLEAYMLRLSATPLSERDMTALVGLMYAVGDAERIGDHTVSLSAALDALRSDGGGEHEAELEALVSSAGELLRLTEQACDDDAAVTAGSVTELCSRLSAQCEAYRERQVARLEKGQTSPTCAAEHFSLAAALGRIAAHCASIVEYGCAAGTASRFGGAAARVQARVRLLMRRGATAGQGEVK